MPFNSLCEILRFRKKIDDTKFIELARRYGVPDRMIARALSLEKLRMGLGIEEVAE